MKLRFLALAVLAGVALAGCDDHVVVDRDTTIPIRKGMTWAWRPAGPQSSDQASGRASDHSSDRRVVSRDVIRPGPSNGPRYQRNTVWENDIVRNRIAHALEQALNSRGLVQASDPANADFLVDYQFAVRAQRERVATPVYAPGLVCGYYSCWQGFYGPPGVYVHTVQYREGTIVFDFDQRERNRIAYRAVRENIVHSDSFTDDEVREGVKHMLKGLKPTK